jgi:pseudaminic acid synthase
MMPSELAQMVEQIRMIEKVVGNVSYDLSDKMKKNRKFSRSLFVVKDIKKGDLFTEDNIKSIRPGDGISPKYLIEILGKYAARDIYKGTPLANDMWMAQNI